DARLRAPVRCSGPDPFCRRDPQPLQRRYIAVPPTGVRPLALSVADTVEPVLLRRHGRCRHRGGRAQVHRKGPMTRGRAELQSYRIEPTRAQATALGDMLADFCQLYNAGLEQRIAAYRRGRISVSYKMQANELKGVRCAAPELARWSFSA